GCWGVGGGCGEACRGRAARGKERGLTPGRLAPHAATRGRGPYPRRWHQRRGMWRSGCRMSGVPGQRSGPPARRVRKSSSGDTPPQFSDPPELFYCFFDRTKLLDEWNHAVFSVVELLRLLEHLGRLVVRHYGDAVFVGRDDVPGAHSNAGTRHWNVDTRDAVMVD